MVNAQRSTLNVQFPTESRTGAMIVDHPDGGRFRAPVEKAAASRRTPKRWRVCRAPGTSRSVWSAQARLRFVAARNQTDSMMIFGDTVVGHAKTKRRQAAALRNAGASAERPVHREALGVRKLACALL